jgi:periplasmic glucans biosynthesis protein
MHGGKSPGAPKGNRNAWKHGHYSVESKQLRRFVHALAKLAKQTIAT